jgi:hypothetical protein
MIVCIHEDRRICQTPLKLLLLSLSQHSPCLDIKLFYPPADAGFRKWLRTHINHGNISLNVKPLEGISWNVKPHALLEVFGNGHKDILWIDSDIILTRDIRPIFNELDSATLVVTEEALYGNDREDKDAQRARQWGFEVGRTLPFVANSSVIRVTDVHVPLLKKWRTLLECEQYRTAQSSRGVEPPAHMFGDQDVLTALLTSRDFSYIPIQFLTRGRDIIQYFGPYGYTLTERIQNILFGLPPFIHSQVWKPWSAMRGQGRSNLRGRFNTLYLECSPYSVLALRYKNRLEEDNGWMRPTSSLAALFRKLGLGYPSITGLPLSAVADLFRIGKWFSRLKP